MSRPPRPRITPIAAPILGEFLVGISVTMAGLWMASRVSDATAGAFGMSQQVLEALFVLFRVLALGVGVNITPGARRSADRIGPADRTRWPRRLHLGGRRGRRLAAAVRRLDAGRPERAAGGGRTRQPVPADARPGRAARGLQPGDGGHAAGAPVRTRHAVRDAGDARHPPAAGLSADARRGNLVGFRPRGLRARPHREPHRRRGAAPEAVAPADDARAARPRLVALPGPLAAAGAAHRRARCGARPGLPRGLPGVAGGSGQARRHRSGHAGLCAADPALRAARQPGHRLGLRDHGGTPGGLGRVPHGTPAGEAQHAQRPAGLRGAVGAGRG